MKNKILLFILMVAVTANVIAQKDKSNDKKSRINKSIAKGLHENCATAYMYIYDFDNAIGHGRNFLKLYGNFHTNRTDSFDVLMINLSS